MKQSLLQLSILSFIALIFCTVSCSHIAVERDPASVVEISPQAIVNQLKTFTSDGCGRFPHSIKYPNQDKWDLCCVQHDISYWKGGTSDDRLEADKQLRQCIIERGDPNAAALVYLGVRATDSEAFPTSQHWGYGWKLHRGYTPHSAEEQQQIDAMIRQIPADLKNVRITPPPTNPLQKSDSLTGNFCIDGVLTFIQHQLRRAITPMRIEHHLEVDGMGHEQTVKIYDKNFTEAYVFTFHLSRQDACSIPAAKWPKGMDVQLKSYSYPGF